MRRSGLIGLILLALSSAAWATTTTSTSTSTSTTTSTSLTTLPMEEARAPVSVLQECTSLCVAGPYKDGHAESAYLATTTKGAAALAWTARATGTFVVQLERCLEDSPQTCDQRGSWVAQGATCNSSPCGPTTVSEPVGWYRTNFTTCTGCTLRSVLRLERHQGGSF